MSLDSLRIRNADDTNLGEALKIWSCINCRRRKVRCDRRDPCAPCIRNNADCVFPVSGRLPRRGRDTKYPHQKQAELLGRLRRLEAMVGDLGSEVENAASLGSQSVDNPLNAFITRSDWSGDQQSAPPSRSASGDHFSKKDGVQASSDVGKNTSGLLQESQESEGWLAAGNGEFVVKDRFWTGFCKEVEQIFEAVAGPSSDHFDANSSSSVVGTKHNTGYYYNYLRSLPAAHRLEDLYPLPSQIPFLWQIYNDNVNPFMKVLHVPTMTKVIREVKGSYEFIPLSMQALLLAISLAAIMSLDDQEVRLNFNTDRARLLNQYRQGTERCLEKADILNDPNMEVLQALTIYLGALQHTGESRPAWLLTGVLVRVAVSMKLHVDGVRSGPMSVFNIELRRKLWWQICLVDSRSEDRTVSKFKVWSDMFDTKIPTNIDDTIFDRETLEQPVSTAGWTDMTVFLIRCEVWSLSNQLRAFRSASNDLTACINERQEIFRKAQLSIEDTYLKHVNLNIPLHGFIQTMIRLFFTKINLILTAQQCSTQTSASGDSLFTQSLSIVEYIHSLQTNPTWSRWRWQIQGDQPPWAALTIVLHHLSLHARGPIFDRAWRSAQISLDSIPEAVQRDPQYQQLKALASKIRIIRSDQPQLEDTSPGILKSAFEDPPSKNDSDLIFPSEKASSSENVPGSTQQDPYLIPIEEFSNAFSTQDLSINMDWQAWDNIARDLDADFDFWDLGNI